MEILGKFLFEVCGLKAEWNLGDFIGETVEEIRCQVGERKVLCALSGGVDSSVAATLVHSAVGDQLICVFVDNGLMRKGEPEQVVKTFRDQMKMNLVAVDARERFINKLAGEKIRNANARSLRRVYSGFEEEKNKWGISSTWFKVPSIPI